MDLAEKCFAVLDLYPEHRKFGFADYPGRKGHSTVNYTGTQSFINIFFVSVVGL